MKAKIVSEYPHLADHLHDIKECQEYKNLLYRSTVKRPTKDKIYN